MIKNTKILKQEYSIHNHQQIKEQCIKNCMLNHGNLFSHGLEVVTIGLTS